MGAVSAGMLLAAIVAVGAAFVLNSEVQRSAADPYSTEAVRLRRLPSFILLSNQVFSSAVARIKPVSIL